MVGYGDGIIGQRLADLIVDETGEHLAEVRQALLAHGAWQGEASYRHKEGYALPIQVSLLLIRDAAGEPLGSAAVVRDLRAQRQAEQEHTALQEQVIAAQQAALRELSTPLIPLTDNVVVMPLIGTIDGARSQQILEVLLEGIALHQAEAVLLDISGVRVVDTQVADALLRAAKAVRLLGAQVILTGLSAEVAQTMVHLGADLGDIVTQGNLQAGLRYAMDRYDSGGVAPGARYRSQDR
jgi:rsbT co-antagonist protein RsbR